MMVYIRPGGSHYHALRDCTMLKDGDFERLGYRPIELEKVNRKKYRPCACAIERKTKT